MGRPPAVVIVARHGARLDIADKQWHLTSPAPYDPPLTYGGWSQCRALGGRIAALLRARELLFEQTLIESLGKNENQGNGSGGTKQGPKEQLLQRRKKHRVFIHSSPFLRCVQTSVAIGAGISQYIGDVENPTNGSASQPTTVPAKPVKQGTPILSPIKDEDEDREPNHSTDATPKMLYFKPRLRVDAFLGEWLAPEYYESITPPPSSVMMVATAKAELLRRGEHIQGHEDVTHLPSARGHFPGGWSSRNEPNDPPRSEPRSEEEQLLARVAKLTTLDPKTHSRERAKTQGEALGQRKSPTPKKPTTPDGSGYVAPIPPYAISPSEPIPSGYVQHARDACVEVDFQWDSMRAPLDWGDGGTLGEEWSAMHKRFRRGLHRLISWYSQHRQSAQQLHGHTRVRHPHPHEPDDEDTDNVVVLVTHGAGCNALIGALTNQPVLLDVSMASLTMAVQRDSSNATQPSSPEATSPRSPYGPSSPINPSLSRYENERPLSKDYIVTLTASTEHLTTSPFAPVTLQDLTSSSRPSTPTESSSSTAVTRRSSRRRYTPSTPMPHERSSSLNQLPDAPSPAPHRPRLASVGRSTTSVEAPARGAAEGGVATSTGLWSRPSPDGKLRHPRTWSLVSEDVETPKPVVPPPTSVPNEVAVVDGGKEIAKDDESEGALWQARHVDESPERERGMKRRWTMAGRERDEAGV